MGPLGVLLSVLPKREGSCLTSRYRRRERRVPPMLKPLPASDLGVRSTGKRLSQQPAKQTVQLDMAHHLSSVRASDTKPEWILRGGLHRLGFRYRLHRKDLPGKPDLVFPKYRSVVFAHGCFGIDTSNARMRQCHQLIRSSGKINLLPL